MALVTKDFRINITPGEMPPTVHVSEYDIGRAYNVTLVDENGNAFEIPSGTTATVEGTLNGTVGFTTSATISGNQISFALTESMTSYAGQAWCKIKLTLNSEPIQTCAFVLAVDRAGVEADTVIGAPGFEEQIVNAVNDWLDEHPPASGGMTEEFKQALLDCFENVAWINDDGQTYYDALYNALYPPVDVLSISAVFTQGSAAIYETDSLDTLRQYLVVTATMTDSTTQTVTDYTLSGTLTVGTSTITVLYNGKTATFNVTVSEFRVPSEYQEVEYIEGTGTQYIHTPIKINSDTVKFELGYYKATQATREESIVACASGESSSPVEIGFNATANRLFAFSSASAQIVDHLVYGQNADLTVEFNNTSPYAVMTLKANGQTLTGSKTTANNPSIPNANINLFQTGEGFNTCAARLKYLVVSNYSGAIMDALPCYRKSDGEIGLYDRVTRTFFTNIGTGVFLKGGDV